MRLLEGKRKTFGSFEQGDAETNTPKTQQKKTIDKLTEQNQLLLESSQEKEEKKVGFWGQLIGQRA